MTEQFGNIQSLRRRRARSRAALTPKPITKFKAGKLISCKVGFFSDNNKPKFFNEGQQLRIVTVDEDGDLTVNNLEGSWRRGVYVLSSNFDKIELLPAAEPEWWINLSSQERVKVLNMIQNKNYTKSLMWNLVENLAIDKGIAVAFLDWWYESGKEIFEMENNHNTSSHHMGHEEIIQDEFSEKDLKSLIQSQQKRAPPQQSERRNSQQSAQNRSSPNKTTRAPRCPYWYKYSTMQLKQQVTTVIGRRRYSKKLVEELTQSFAVSAQQSESFCKWYFYQKKFGLPTTQIDKGVREFHVGDSVTICKKLDPLDGMDGEIISLHDPSKNRHKVKIHLSGQTKTLWSQELVHC